MNPIVETADGRISGIRSGGVLRFAGMRYGADTSGPNRFRPPQPVEKWAGVQAAEDFGPIAPQTVRAWPVGFNDTDQGEDCLRINVWTAGTTGSRPVVVWLHGGGFGTGKGDTADTDGARLAARGDVVVVSLNHRLGLLGFLDLEGVVGEDFDGSANAGLFDIVAALRWVQTNIAAFGGDPSRVSIFGHSGGGGKVSAVSSMPAGRGLFHTASVHAGVPMGSRDRLTTTGAAAQALAALGLTRSDAHRVRELPVSAFTGLQNGTFAVGGQPGKHGLLFSPVVGASGLPVNPYEAYASGFARDVALLTGTTRDEARYAMFATAAYRDPDFDLDDGELLGRLRPGLDEPDAASGLVERYRALSPGIRNVDLMFDVLSDQFRIRTIRLASAKYAGGGKDTYVYYCDANADGRHGSFHGVEMPLFFDTVDSDADTEATPERRAVAARVSGDFVAFAATGTPGASEPWATYTPRERRVTHISDTAVLASDEPLAERVAAWDGVLLSPRTDPWTTLF